MTRPDPTGTPPLADQPSAKPTPKLIAGVSVGTLTIGVVWAAGRLGWDLTPEAAGGLVLAAGSAAAWLKRNRAAVLDVLDRRGGGAHHDLDGDGVADGTQPR